MWRNKGVSVGLVMVVGIALFILGFFFVALLRFYSSSQLTLSDRVASGMSAINYFYITEKNIKEFVPLLMETTAKELGEQCGGFDCYWAPPTLDELLKKYNDSLISKITGFPEHIGTLGKFNFVSPSEINIEHSDNWTNTTMSYQQIKRESGSFKVEATSTEALENNKSIRYQLLLKLTKRLYENGMYIRDAGKVYVNSGEFDCDDDGVAEITITNQKLSAAGVEGCKVISIDFSLGEDNWNNLKSLCRIASVTGEKGEVKSGKLYAPINDLFKFSMICGIDSTDGLAAINDFYGEDHDSKTWSDGADCTEGSLNIAEQSVTVTGGHDGGLSCTAEGALSGEGSGNPSDWINLDNSNPSSKFNNIKNAFIAAFSDYYLKGLNIYLGITESYIREWKQLECKTPDYKLSCGEPASGDEIEGTCRRLFDKTYNEYDSCGCGDSSNEYYRAINHDEYGWNSKKYFEYLYTCTRTAGCRQLDCCDWGEPYDCNCVTDPDTGDETCDTCQDCEDYDYETYYRTSEIWTCKYKSWFEFALKDVDFTLKLIDPTIKIPIKYTTTFEELYMGTKAISDYDKMRCEYCSIDVSRCGKV